MKTGAAARAAVPDSGIEGPGLYQLLVESVRDYAIFALDAKGYVVTWNRGAERFKGYKAHEIIGKHFSTFYPPEDADTKPPLELAIAEKEGRVEDEGWRVRKDGSRLWANVIITALRDPSGKLIGFAKVTRDLTERRLAEQKALADATRLAEVEAANRAKADFLAAMSHELRTPLNAIGGYAELLKMGVRGEVNEQQKEDLERIVMSQRHLLGIINDLLNFSRIEAGKISYAAEPVNLPEVLDAVIQMIGPLATAKNIEVRRGDCVVGTIAIADRAKVEQIIINLASNAVSYTETGGVVTVECGSDGDRVWARVSDNGIGISAEKLEAIFEPFVQVGRTLSTGHHGTGLGLAISRDLARGMKGDLAVESQLGEGSVFSLTLPRLGAG
ncbi:MAG TPA: PAS domain-containing sensor histidine kinase [Gemmatimonadaceae bacterium]|nr:PAS domain-containing sensor histidine kinase [Gemmatimonadaceae bacterium]